MIYNRLLLIKFNDISKNDTRASEILVSVTKRATKRRRVVQSKYIVGFVLGRREPAGRARDFLHRSVAVFYRFTLSSRHCGYPGSGTTGARPRAGRTDVISSETVRFHSLPRSYTTTNNWKNRYYALGPMSRRRIVFLFELSSISTARR